MFRAPNWTLVLAALVSACAGGPDVEAAEPYLADGEAPPPVLSRPWTGEFLRPSALVAGEVRIEGPPGLLEHVAARPDPLFHELEVKTVPDGLLQTITRKPGGSPVEIYAWLDAMEIAALTKLVILERPGGDEVRIVGRGDAWWRVVGGDERRGPLIELSARIGGSPGS
jgi:hypothetical protein